MQKNWANCNSYKILRYMQLCTMIKTFYHLKFVEKPWVVVKNYHEMLKKYYLLESSFHILAYVIITEYIHKNISSNKSFCFLF